MNYKSEYVSPLGKIILTSDEYGLNGLYFEDQKFIDYNTISRSSYFDDEYIVQAKKWLDIYFSKKSPSFIPKLHIIGTKFQIEVWNELLAITYGKTTTYGEIANKIAIKRNIKKMSSQAIGSAISHNHISIIIPCHRVIGKNGSLVGYASGIKRKDKLLQIEHEKCNLSYAK